MLAVILGLLDTASPVDILIATNGALTIAIAALYRDCRKDREKLWGRVRQLEDSRSE